MAVRDRLAALDAVPRRAMADTESQAVGVLIAGAGVGINEAEQFRDFCAQRLTCMIADKGDVGSRTSAAPSRLIHGGLKLLAFEPVAIRRFEINSRPRFTS